MLKIFFELGEMDNIEKNLLAEGANRLGVGEFQLFQLAYYDWHGSDLEAQRMERAFFEYLTNDKIPPWARHYARRIIALDDDGNLEYNDPEYHRYDVSSMQGREVAGLLKALLVLAVFGVFLVSSIVLLNERLPKESTCQFPPCINIP